LRFTGSAELRDSRSDLLGVLGREEVAEEDESVKVNRGGGVGGGPIEPGGLRRRAREENGGGSGRDGGVVGDCGGDEEDTEIMSWLSLDEVTKKEIVSRPSW
jgi:hypothetical protein